MIFLLACISQLLHVNLFNKVYLYLRLHDLCSTQAHGYYLPATPPHPTYSTPHPTYSSPPHQTYSTPPHPTYSTPPHPTYSTPPHPTYSTTPPGPTYPTTASPQGVGPDPPPNYSELYPRTTGQTTPQGTDIDMVD